MDYLNILHKQKLILEEKGYSVAYICIYGSQNYNLDIQTDDYKSDIDMKAIVVPTLDDLVKNSKPVSTVIDTEWGQCDIKDIRSYIQTLIKANPAYIETLYTHYSIVDERYKKEFGLMLGNADELVETLKYQFIRAAYGMMCEKEKAMCHPYPTIAHKIEKFGFDGKQVHHIFRLLLLLKDYFEEANPLNIALIPPSSDIELLMDLKLNNLTLEEVKPLVKKWMEEGKKLRDKILSESDESKINYTIKDEYLKWSQEVVKKNIKKECIREVLVNWLN